VERGSTDSVLADPADPYTRELLRSIPVLGQPLDLEA
jgi:ABC-type oligopeptide transport system ATPase subunit